jgi:hypothetical protein
VRAGGVTRATSEATTELVKGVRSMSSEIHLLSDLHRDILNRLMAGWQTMDAAKEEGFVRLSELSAELAVPADDLRPELELLEVFGFVESVHSMGMDQTERYKGIEQVTTRQYNPDDPVYFISENGKRRVLAELMSEQGEDAGTSPA